MPSKELEPFYDELLQATILKETSDYANAIFDKIASDATKVNWVLQNALKYKDQKLIVFLLSSNAGIEVNALNAAIHSAIYNDFTEIIDSLFLQCGSRKNYIDDRGLSHFHVACITGNEGIVNNFLLDGIDLNLRCQYDVPNDEVNCYTPLHLAVKNLHDQITGLLLNFGADPNAIDDSGRTALHLACLGSRKKPSDLPLHDQMMEDQSCQLEMIKLLIDCGANVNARDSYGNTPLFSIFENDFEENLYSTSHNFFGTTLSKRQLVRNFRKTQSEKLNLLIQNFADTKATNNQGDTILHQVINDLKISRKPNTSSNGIFDDNASVEMVRALLQVGVNINARNEKGESPLHLAISLLSFDIVEALLNRNADIDNLHFKDDSFGCFESEIPNFEATNNLLKIIEALASKGFHLTYRDNQMIQKFLVSNRCGDNPHFQDGDLLYKMKNLLELGVGANIIVALEQMPANMHDTSFNGQSMKIKILEHLKNHLNILNRGNLYVSDQVKDCLKLNITKLENSILKILSPEDNSNETNQQQIELEIQKMKDTMLNNYTSLYSILGKNPENIHTKIRSYDYRSILESSNFDENSPFSAGIIKGHFTKCLVRNYLSRSANDYLKNLVNYNLPDLCCDKIFEYLNNGNLRDLCIAASD